MRRWGIILLALLPLAALAAEPQPRPSFVPLAGGGLTQMLLGLGAVLALIGGGVWLLRRYPTLRGGEGAIKVIGGLPLSARERLLLVEVEGTRLLLGVAPGRVQTLHVFAAGAAGGPFGEPFGGPFAAALRAVQHRD
jgi:flagellar protein FliO/FliZ